MYIIGIDIGTTNSKAVAFATDGAVLGSAGAGYPVITDADGRHELDPDKLLAAVLSVLGEVYRNTGVSAGVGRESAGVGGDGLAGAGRGGLAGISFSCAFHSLILVDGKGMPLTPAMTWADLRPSQQAKALRGTEAGARIYRHTGTPIHAMSPLCKLLWLRSEQPGLFGRAARFISIKEYIWWRLFGQYLVDHSLASATGLFDIRRLEWYAESLALAGIDEGQLSAPAPCTHVETELSAGGRELLAGACLPEGLPFIIGGGDGCLANLGSSAIRHGDTALTIGTSGAIRMTASTPEDDPGERIFNYIIAERHYACGGATNNGGNVLQWYVQRILGVRDGDEDELHRRIAEAAGIPPGAAGLVFLPYLQGERAPVWDAGARGVFFGVRALHDHRHFTRACLEGVAFALYQIGSSLEETIGPIQHIFASGGFTRSEAWLQLVADIFGKRLHVTGAADASAVGAAMMGMYALRLVESLEDAASLVKVVRTFEPDEGRHGAYQANYRIYTRLYDRLKDLM